MDFTAVTSSWADETIIPLFPDWIGTNRINKRINKNASIKLTEGFIFPYKFQIPKNT